MGHNFDTNNRFIYGTLCKDQDGNFIYCCNNCSLEFSIITDLEAHTFAHIVKHENDENLTNLDDYYELKALRVPVERLNSDYLEETGKLDTNNLDSIEIKCETLQSPSPAADDNNSNYEWPISIETIANNDECVLLDIINETDSLCNSPKKQKDKTSPKLSQRKEIKYEQCNICGKNVFNFNLKRHMLIHNRTTKRIVKFEPCTVCGKKLINHNIKRHMLIHTDEYPYECFICHKGFKQSPCLKIHLSKHSGEKPFVCDVCGLTYISRKSLTLHTLIHSDKAFKCTQCEFTFRYQFKLKRHISRVHEKKRPYLCSVCGKSFSGADGKAQHMRTHAEKSFSCRFCDRKFTHSSNRRTHEKGIHHVQ